MRRAALIYVYRLKIACPVCRRKDGGCSVTEDRRRALCWKVPSTDVSPSGFFWHDITDHTVLAQLVMPEREAAEDKHIAPVELRDRVYSDFLARLTLTPRHLEELTGRGLNAESIKAAQLRTLPTIHEAVYITDEIARTYDPLHVPGFWRAKNGAFGIKLSGAMTTRGGFLIPVCDPFGRIQALQIRRNDAETAKYVWLSSSGLDPDKYPEAEGGASTGAPAHYCNVNRMRTDGAVLVTEGALKSVIIGHLTDAGVIGFAGLHPPPDFISTIKTSLPEVRMLELAFDADWRDRAKPNIKRALFKMLSELRATGYTATVRTWSRTHKDLDDLLLAQRRREAAA